MAETPAARHPAAPVAAGPDSDEDEVLGPNGVAAHAAGSHLVFFDSVQLVNKLRLTSGKEGDPF